MLYAQPIGLHFSWIPKMLFAV